MQSLFINMARPMNLINDPDPARHAARSLSERLGTLAAEQHPETAFTQLNPAAPAISPRLASILEHFRKRAQTREHMHHKLLAQEFMAGS